MGQVFQQVKIILEENGVLNHFVEKEVAKLIIQPDEPNEFRSFFMKLALRTDRHW